MKSDDGPGGDSVSSTETAFDGTTFTLTFWPEFVVVAVICVSTLAPTEFSWTAALQQNNTHAHTRENEKKKQHQNSNLLTFRLHH